MANKIILPNNKEIDLDVLETIPNRLKNLEKNGTPIKKVDEFNDLPKPSDKYYDNVYIVRKTTGIIGSRKLAGMYICDGKTWKRISRNQLKAYDSDLLDGHSSEYFAKQEDFVEFYKKENWSNMISGGGDITWSNDYKLSTSERLILIPTNDNKGHINIKLNNLKVNEWCVAYIDLTKDQLKQNSLNLNENDFIVERYNQYSPAQTPFRFVLGYHNGDNHEFVFSSGKVVSKGITLRRDTGFIEPSLKNSWRNYGGSYANARYRRINNVVYIEGLVKNGSRGKAIFVLPNGFRPSKRLLLSTETNSNANGRLDIKSNGEVIMVKGNNSWFSITCSFVCEQ